MKRTLVLLLIALLCLALCAPGALAAPSLWARMEDGGLVASWTACNCAQAALTVYREDWPILAACVSGADGCFRVPAGYTQAAGRYAVQLRCAHGCARAEVGKRRFGDPRADRRSRPNAAPAAQFDPPRPQNAPRKPRARSPLRPPPRRRSPPARNDPRLPRRSSAR